MENFDNFTENQKLILALQTAKCCHKQTKEASGFAGSFEFNNFVAWEKWYDEKIEKLKEEPAKCQNLPSQLDRLAQDVYRLQKEYNELRKILSERPLLTVPDCATFERKCLTKEIEELNQKIDKLDGRESCSTQLRILFAHMGVLRGKVDKIEHVICVQAQKNCSFS